MIKLKILTILLISLLSFQLQAFAQVNTVFIYRYNQDSIQRESFKFDVWKIYVNQPYGESNTYPDQFVSFEKKKSFSETICMISVKDTTCAYLADLIGHEIFLIPGDTVIVNIPGKPKRPRNSEKHFFLPWNFDLTYDGKNKFVYSLFDSLTYETGDLRMNKIRFTRNDSLSVYCEKVDSQHVSRLKFLDQYCKRHDIGNRFKQLAKAEIDGVYFSYLVRPVNSNEKLTFNDYPKHFRETILNSRFIDPYLYSKTALYRSAAFTSAENVLPSKKISMKGSDNDLVLIYKAIKLNFPDTIRNNLLTFHLSQYLGNEKLIFPSMDSLITDFKSVCKNLNYIHHLDSLNVLRKNSFIINKTLTDAMSSQITDMKDRVSDPKLFFRSKPVLIICWASWCEPCLKEIPFEQKLQDQYGDKIDFIYLSFDRDKKLWLNKLKTLSIKVGQNYLLTNNFKSDFAEFYRISSIPSYLLYDKKGNRVQLNNLRPSQDGFKSVLENLTY